MIKLYFISLFSFLQLLFIQCNHIDKKIQVDSIIIASKIYYFENEEWTNAQAIAILDGEIIELGDSSVIIEKYNATNIQRSKGYIFPGLIDAHCHFWGLAKTLLQVDLMGAKSWEEVLSRCKLFSEENPHMEWISGRGWDESLWESNVLPDNSKLNEIFPNKPVFIRRVDGHAGIANQKALEMAKITSETKIEGGEIDFLKGILIDNAMNPMSSIFPEPSKESMVKGLIKAGEICNNFGLTSLADAGLDANQILLIDSLIQENLIHLRLYAMLSNTPENLVFAKENGIIKQDKLRIYSFKFYADGALGSMGAKLKQPYCGTEKKPVNGLILTSEEALEKMYSELFKIGYQAHTHCIGDSANKMVLGLYNKVLNGAADRRWRIEHAQVLDPIDFPLFGENYILPSIQPIHATSDMRWAEKRLCAHRLDGAYAYRSLLKQCGMIAIGTDFPVETPDPFANFYAAVSRKNTSHFPDGGFLPTQKLDRKDALRGMTEWAAYSIFMDDLIGNLIPGKKADFVILDTDLLNCNAELIPESKVIGTYLDGKKIQEIKNVY